LIDPLAPHRRAPGYDATNVSLESPSTEAPQRAPIACPKNHIAELDATRETPAEIRTGVEVDPKRGGTGPNARPGVQSGSETGPFWGVLPARRSKWLGFGSETGWFFWSISDRLWTSGRGGLGSDAVLHDCHSRPGPRLYVAESAETVMKWLGKNHRAAEEAQRIAREDGMSPYRAQVAGHIASFQDAWSFRSTIAELVGCSVKTVQRATNQLKELGRIVTYPALPTEVLPGRTRPLRVWASHRIYQWGVKAVQRAKVAVLSKAVVQPGAKPPKAPPKPYRERAAEAGFPDVASWLDAMSRPPPKPG